MPYCFHFTRAPRNPACGAPYRRPSVTHTTRDIPYYVQTQAPAGNWVDEVGFQTFEAANRNYLARLDQFPDRPCRIVERRDHVLAHNPIGAR